MRRRWRSVWTQVVPGVLLLIVGMALTRMGNQRLRHGLNGATGGRRWIF